MIYDSPVFGPVRPAYTTGHFFARFLPMSDHLPTSLTVSEIGRQICASLDRFLDQRPVGNTENWEDLVGQMLCWVRRLDPDIAFSALLWILETQTRYQYQLVAGELLDRAGLASNLPLRDLSSRILPQFDESAETIPKYLRNAFGREKVEECLRETALRRPGENVAAKIRTMIYWVGKT